MADSTPLPDAGALRRAERFTRERFVHDGELPEDALALGSARRRALDAALAELDAGLKAPSVAWRREYSLLLGLERVLSEDEPRLADGTLLNPHQVDALSGTLTALMAEVQSRSANGNGTNNGSANGRAAVEAPPEEEPAELASAAIPGEEELELDELDEDEEPDEEPQDWQDESEDEDAQLAEQPEDPNAAKRFWFEHATGAGKTVAALGFVDASRTGGVLILTHRRNLVDQFHGELRDRGYGDRIAAPLLAGRDNPKGPVTVETYQWFVRNAGQISDAYTIVICDEAHTALGEKTSASIRRWAGPVFVGMTATGALIARHVTDLFPTQTSRFDLAQAARRGVISPLRCIRIPPGPGVRTIAKVPLRRGEVDTEFDQDMLAELLDQLPFNLAIADLYKTRFNGVPGVVYTAGVRHAYNVAQAFRDVGVRAQAVSGETPKRELARILAEYERGTIDVLINAQLLAEGWNSPRATICMHLAPTASKRIYQQRVGRVTRRHPGKEAGIVIDFVHPATKHDDPVVTLHSLLDRDVYRGGAIVVGPVRRGRGRRVRVERRVLPVTPDPERRAEVFERELWRIAVEHLDYGEQHVWAALAGARVAPNGWRRAKAMLHFDRQGDLKRRFLITAVERNRNAQLRLRALQEIAAARDAEAFDTAIDLMATWPRDERREGVKIMLQALAEKRIGRRDQANAWIWRMAEYTREVHEEYAVQRWPETKRLLGLLVNSSGGAHARNARRLVHAARRQDRRLSAALLAAALAHTPEAEEALRGARTRMARKPSALARELLRNFPRGRRGRGSRRRRKGAKEGVAPEGAVVEAAELDLDLDLELDDALDDDELDEAPRRSRRGGPSPAVVEEAYDEALDGGERGPDAPPLLADGREDVEDAVADALAHDADGAPAGRAARRRRRAPARRANGAIADGSANGNGESPGAEAALELVSAAAGDAEGGDDPPPARRRRAARRRRPARAVADPGDEPE
ncbi:MAG TPA: DEAD/DEAH box helicase family protein [Conexibacter sp.]|jgi:ribonuclease E|nr:DEAD/DEAH box helicase family protein [Conexibacter sp.]